VFYDNLVPVDRANIKEVSPMFNKVQPVTLSPRAAEEVRKIMKKKSIPDGYGLRIGARGGSGCGGTRLIIGFDKQRKSDLSYEEQGIRVYVDKKHTMYVIGKEVDYYDAEDGNGFVFVDTPKE
jgi:iron-sulfur cluster assembly protein